MKSTSASEYKALMLSIFVLVSIPVASLAGDEYVEKFKSRDEMVNMCNELNLFGDTYCNCAANTSISLTNNDPIFELFMKSANKTKNEIIEVYDNLVNSQIYNEYGFKSKKEKMEYIEGKFDLFSHRLHVDCKS